MTNASSRALSGGEAPAAIAARYLLFAIIAGAMNLGAQAIVFAIVPVRPLELSILAGTGVGFVVKYLLDKRWIFFDDYDGAAKEARKIFLYGSFSVAMTLVFWAFEVGFLAIWGTNTAKYIGAVIGLAIGNFAKYLLDRTFTFNQGRARKTREQADADAEARSWN